MICREPLPARSSAQQLWGMAQRVTPYLLFAALFASGWRAWDFFRAVPSYEDVLEVVWTIAWYNGAIRGLHSAAVNPLAFFPSGWQVASYSEGPVMFLLLLPLSWLGGEAFAYNIALLLAFLIGFLGARKLASRLLGPWPAVVAALLFTFWGFHWMRYVGHMNILLAVALLPWMVCTFDNARTPTRKRYLWLILTGFFWALMIVSSWYFAWIGVVLLFGWAAGCLLGRRLTWTMALANIALATGSMLVFTAPALIWFVRATAAANGTFFDIREVNHWNASLNSFPVPSADNPWLQTLVHRLYKGPVDESGRANFGLLAFILALVGTALAWRNPRWRPVLIITGLGLLLALGLTLQWNGRTVKWAAMRPLDLAIWQLGHRLKPEFFTTPLPPSPFDAAIPLPSLFLSAIVPLWERARVFARYALLASTGLFLLSALALARVPWRWARIGLGLLLVLEVMPSPTGNKPFPLPSHPAFEWLAQQQLPAGQGIVDIHSTPAEINGGGGRLWESEFHGKPTVVGAGSIWPAHVSFLSEWLNTHPHAFLEPDFVPLLRFYRVALIMYSMDTPDAGETLQEARWNSDLRVERCFEPLPGPSPWAYPVCAIWLGSGPPDFNLLQRVGWSGAESWGRWIEGTRASAEWAATARAPQRLTLQAFPLCVLNRPQTLTVLVNDVEVARHEWTNCDQWTTEIDLPASLVRIGWNTLALHGAFAARPMDQPNASNPDSRWLSVGITKLRVE